MTRSEITELRSFESDVRQLIKSYKAMQSELSDVRRQLSERDEKIAHLESDLRIARHSYSTLKVARMIEVSDSDLKESKSRITRLVREVNKCISLLSSEIDDTDSSEKLTDDKPEDAVELLPIELSIDDKESDSVEEPIEEESVEEPIEEVVEEESVEEPAEEVVEEESVEEPAKESVEEPANESVTESSSSSSQGSSDPWDLNSLPLFSKES